MEKCKVREEKIIKGRGLLGLMYSVTEALFSGLMHGILPFLRLGNPLNHAVDLPGKDSPDFHGKSMKGPQANLSARTQLQDGDFWSRTV